MKKLILFLVLMFVLAPYVYSIPSLDIGMVLTNDNAEIKSVKYIEGIPYQSESSFSHWIRVFRDDSVIYSASFPVDFVLLSNPPVLRDEVEEHIIIPYQGNKGVVEVLLEDKVIANFDLARLCNYDGICGGIEGELLCAEDCFIREDVVLEKVEGEKDQPNYTTLLIVLGIVSFVIGISLSLFKIEDTSKRKR